MAEESNPLPFGMHVGFRDRLPTTERNHPHSAGRSAGSAHHNRDELLELKYRRSVVRFIVQII